ncbi:PREDICTED: uncharacterized protein LOC109469577 [Branchiostoma belcheri]|uniref:Uncharacterized protein LOC109469577 n=1 Tax=Branchiostoma belcheri TaxID=7741 RepID=A0A6P4Y3U8_BRABE|nr:PREDICTED: uncharacterized protein LOC109469577 [Branchiostoma belcheri]
MLSCNVTNDKQMCFPTCRKGYQFATPISQSYVCDSTSGQWSPAGGFPECIPEMLPAVTPGKSMAPVVAGVRHRTYISAQAGMCTTWGQHHFRTFDGRIFNFKGTCSYVLAKDCFDLTFSIHVHNDRQCRPATKCQRSVTVFLGQETLVMRNDAEGPSVYHGEDKVKIPTNMFGTVIEKVAGFVMLRSGLGFKIEWDGEEAIFVWVSEPLFDKTCGLCGRWNRDPSDDFTDIHGNVAYSLAQFANSWKMPDSFSDSCPDASTDTYCQSNTEERYARSISAINGCSYLMNTACTEMVDPNPYFEACKEDICFGASNRTSLECDSMEAYFRECTRQGISIAWRAPDRCGMTCQNGMVYDPCGSSCPQTCYSHTYDCVDNHCVDGCHCPSGTFLHNNQCIPREECPCQYRGTEYAPGSRIQQDCNQCYCLNGKWRCTEEQCEAVCSTTGYRHYTTFDGKQYDFAGDCSYTLLMSNPDMRLAETYNVIVENHDCNSGFCYRSVLIKTQGSTLKMTTGHSLMLNGGYEITSLPYAAPGFYVERVSSLFQKVTLDNGLKILWDGSNRVYVVATPDLMGTMVGLCGNFNNQQFDDFYTLSKDIESHHVAFANKWKVEELCPDISMQEESHPCDMYTQRRLTATAKCAILKKEPFRQCHEAVNFKAYYDNCMYDVCATEVNSGISPFCDALADYAHMCAKQGIVLDWRSQVTECELQCTGSLVYKSCGKACRTSCGALAQNHDCEEHCVEGCMCPDDLVLDYDGHCVPVEQCVCLYQGQAFKAGDTVMQECNICECHKGQWICTDNECPQEEECPPHMEWTNCKSNCPRTCSNMHMPYLSCPRGKCIAGCECNNMTVWDGANCVTPSDCPCYHGGRSYHDGETMMVDCNTCTCSGRTWTCENNECPGICSAYGDPHFKSFDGRQYDFQGECEYVIARSTGNNAQQFSISSENIPCGTSGVTCTKSIIFTIGEGDSQKTLTLVRGQDVPKERDTPFQVAQVGLYVFVRTDIGVTLQWDRGTRVYIKLETVHKGKVEGLCGNYNGDQQDDFLMPNGLTTELETEFGNAWKIHDYCADAGVIKDTCTLHPHRKAWAQRKCAIIKSELFRTCHYEVPYQDYYERCVFDACGCDSGGDCECLCTSVATYAQECNLHGVHVHWRSQEFCPMQCGGCTRYNPCLSACPLTCANHKHWATIQSECRDMCVEGCDCPEGKYMNEEYECVHEEECTFCITLDGVPYDEGEKILSMSDDCRSCYCVNHEVECLGLPCPRETSTLWIPTSTTLTQPPAITVCTECNEGWTDWMNAGYPNSVNGGDYETFSVLRRQYSFCLDQEVVDVECRVAEYGTPYNQAGQNVKCDVLNGLTCNNNEQSPVPECYDYEIRFKCQCMEGHDEVCVTTKSPVSTSEPECPPEKLVKCAFKCRQTCHAFRLTRAECTYGYDDTCVPYCGEFQGCPEGYVLRGLDECVTTEDCPCRKEDGTVVPPGTSWKEGECKMCQCWNNKLKCEDICGSSVTISKTSHGFALCDSCIDIISRKVSDDWKLLCMALGCDAKTISRVEVESSGDSFVCCSTMLKHWRDTCDLEYDNKVDVVCRALEHCGYADCAVEVHENFRMEKTICMSDDSFKIIAKIVSGDWLALCTALGYSDDFTKQIISKYDTDSYLCCYHALLTWRDTSDYDYAQKVEHLCYALDLCGFYQCSQTVKRDYQKEVVVATSQVSVVSTSSSSATVSSTSSSVSTGSTEHVSTGGTAVVTSGVVTNYQTGGTLISSRFTASSTGGTVTSGLTLCDDTIDYISTKITTGWTSLCIALGCSSDVIQKVLKVGGDDNVYCCSYMLKTWRDNVDIDYTTKVQVLCDALRTCGYTSCATTLEHKFRTETCIALCDHQFDIYSRLISHDWKAICIAMGCDADLMHKIETDCGHDDYLCCTTLLKTWRDTIDCTYREKVDIFCKALDICGYHDVSYDCRETYNHEILSSSSVHLTSGTGVQVTGTSGLALCDDTLKIISVKISSNWKIVCQALGCGIDFVQKIQHSCGDDFNLCAYTMLRDWCDSIDVSYSDKVTYLCQALDICGFTDCVSIVQDKYRTECSLVLSDSKISHYCDTISRDWKAICIALHCDDDFITRIEHECGSDHHLCCNTALRLWRNTVDCTYNEKVDRFCNALITCGYLDLATECRDYWRHEIYSTANVQTSSSSTSTVVQTATSIGGKVTQGYATGSTSTQLIVSTGGTTTGLALCDDTIKIICDKIADDWTSVCIALGCNADFIQKIMEDCGSDNYLCCITMLKLWRDTYDHADYHVKVNVLITALRTCGFTHCATTVYEKFRTESSVALCDAQIDIYCRTLHGDWKAICISLGCDDDFISKVEYECGSDDFLCCHTALKTWRDTIDCSYAEKIDIFCAACEACGYIQMANDCRHYYRNEVFTSASVSTQYTTGGSAIHVVDTGATATSSTGLALCDDTLRIICKKITDWKLVCVTIGCDKNLVTKVDQDHHGDSYLCCFTMLKHWRDSTTIRYDDKVTTMCNVLKTCGYTDCSGIVMEKYRTECSVVLSDSQIHIYSKTLSRKWKDICTYLGCDDDFIKKIVDDCGTDNYLCCSTALKHWRDTVDCSYAEMIDIFCYACTTCGYHDIATDCKDNFRHEVYVTASLSTTHTVSSSSFTGTGSSYVSHVVTSSTGGESSVTSSIGLALCDDTLRIICHKIDDWKLVCRHLGCDDAFVYKFQQMYRDDTYLCCFHALKTWRDTFDSSYDDKVNHLCLTLRNCGYAHCADTVYNKYRTEHSFALCDSQIDIYSHKMSHDWKAFCIALGCDHDFISKVEQECGHDNYLCISTALKHWRDTVDCSYADKIDYFCSACHACGFTDIAVDCRDNYNKETFVTAGSSSFSTGGTSGQYVSGGVLVTGLALCDDTLRVICHKIADWKLVCRHLGCDDDFVYKIQHKYQDDIYSCCFHALKTWRDTCDVSYDDKFNILWKTLHTCGYYDCANTMYHKYRTEHSFALCDSQIDVYSQKLSHDWKNFCVALKCDDDFINKIDLECGGDNYLCISTALKHWRDTVDCSYDDKIDLFCHACDNRGYHDIAVVCRSNFRYESYGLALCDDTLRVISHKIADWKLVCTHLGCDDAFVHKFQDQYKDDTYLCCFHAFKTWRDTFDTSYDDKYNIFWKALHDCGYYDCADTVYHKYRTEHSFALCDSQIDVYSHKLSHDWKYICVDLKCDDDFINKIELECGGDNYLCISTALKHWRDTVDCSYDDKIDLFCHACDNRGYHDIAVVCRSNFRYESYGLALCDDTLRVISHKIADWKLVCTHLGYDDTFVHKFQDQYKDDTYLCCFHALKTWRDTFDISYDDKVNKLYLTLRTCGYYDCADTVLYKYRTENCFALCDHQINIYSHKLADDWVHFCKA